MLLRSVVVYKTGYSTSQRSLLISYELSLQRIHHTLPVQAMAVVP